MDFVPSSDCHQVCAVSIFLLKAVGTGWQEKPRSCSFKTFSVSCNIRLRYSVLNPCLCLFSLSGKDASYPQLMAAKTETNFEL